MPSKFLRVQSCDAKNPPENVKVLVCHLKKEVLWLLVRECTPRCLKMEATSTAAPPMCRGGGEFLLLLKSKIISFVFLTLMQRLLSLQRLSSLSTSCLQSHSSLLMMHLTTSANFTIWQLWCFAEQSHVSRVHRRRLGTAPWGAPVLKMMGEEELVLILTGCALLVKKTRAQ